MIDSLQVYMYWQPLTGYSYRVLLPLLGSTCTSPSETAVDLSGDLLNEVVFLSKSFEAEVDLMLESVASKFDRDDNEGVWLWKLLDLRFRVGGTLS